MPIERSGLYFMFLGSPSPKFLDPLLSNASKADTVYIVDQVIMSPVSTTSGEMYY